MKESAVKNSKLPLVQKLCKIVLPNEDKRKLKKLVKSNGFDAFIMSVILADAMVLGLMSTRAFIIIPDQWLFMLDRLFMGIFIVEMFLKIYAMRGAFFKSGWNIFDLSIVAISSVPLASAFIVLRTFRIFRMFKFIHRWPLLGDIIDAFIALVPALLGLGVVSVIFFYAFSVIAVSLYGNVLVEYSSLSMAMIMTLETFSIDGWMSAIAAKAVAVFPHAWMFFGVQSLSAFLLLVSFIATAIAEVVNVIGKKRA